MKQGFIGVDTGMASGGIFWNLPGVALGVMPGTTGLMRTVEFCRDLGFEPLVTIEAHNPSKHHGMIKCYGAYKEALGVAKGMHCKFIEVQPRSWQSFMAFQAGEDTKKQSIYLAKKIYPEINFAKVASRCKCTQHDLTDAGLICDYGKTALSLGAQMKKVTIVNFGDYYELSKQAFNRGLVSDKRTDETTKNK